MSLQFHDFNQKVGRERSRQYAKNAAENYQRIKAEFQKADYSIDTLPRFAMADMVPALILGSGPSLDDCLPYVKDFRGIIFASPSQLDILEKWEIIPQYVVSVDTADSVGEEQIRLDRYCYGMTLLAHPYLSPKTLDAWHGNKRYFELLEADGGHFRDMYPWITVQFPVAGSVNNTEVLIARWMGFNPIILAGVDYCFPGGRTRAQDYRKRGPYIFDPKPLQYCETQTGLTTDSQEVAFYSSLLLGIWKMYKLPLVQVGETSHQPEIPFIPPEDIGKSWERGFVPFGPTPEQEKMVDEHLLEYGMYANVDEDGQGHFHYREEEEGAIAQLEAALEVAKVKAEFWRGK